MGKEPSGELSCMPTGLVLGLFWLSCMSYKDTGELEFG